MPKIRIRTLPSHGAAGIPVITCTVVTLVGSCAFLGWSWYQQLVILYCCLGAVVYHPLRMLTVAGSNPGDVD